MARKRKQQTVEELVRQRVDEVLGSANLGRFLEPDLGSRAIASGIMARQTVYDRRKHALYFEKWGCRVCSRKDALHCSNGHCQKCFIRVQHRYDQLRKHWEAEHPVEQIGVDPASKAAKRLIGKL